jgi:ATP-dependent protease HslVU (ClpYQ) peptidase subunit
MTIQERARFEEQIEKRKAEMIREAEDVARLWEHREMTRMIEAFYSGAAYSVDDNSRPGLRK